MEEERSWPISALLCGIIAQLKGLLADRSGFSDSHCTVKLSFIIG
jgi:hypothetical protein